MKTPYFSLVIALVIALVCLPAAAETQSSRVLEVNQPPIHRDIAGVPAATTLNQPPNQVNGLFAEQSCVICTTGQQTIAEDFTVSTGGAGFDLTQIVIWGGYYSTDTPPAADDFDILIHQDSAGLPGTVVCSETALVPTTRTPTGLVLFGVSEYIITLDLSATCNLADGSYWVELYNNTPSVTDDFFWEVGDLDAVNGATGSLWALEIPAVTWNPDTTNELAVQLIGSIVPVELQTFVVE